MTEVVELVAFCLGVAVVLLWYRGLLWWPMLRGTWLQLWGKERTCSACGASFDPTARVYGRMQKTAQRKGRRWKPQICVACLWRRLGQLCEEETDA